MKQAAQDLLDRAGIKINGKNPWDIQVKNEDFYARVLAGGSLALGESYMDGWWECEKIDQFIYKILGIKIEKRVKGFKNIIFNIIKAKFFNQQNKKKAFEVGEKHYDIGNNLYKKMLDKRTIYSCGYWKETDNLEEAQKNKLDLICKKLKLKPGMSLLDIGCGWGGLAKFAAQNYGARVVGVTISKEQAKLAKEECKGLDVKIKLEDFRSLNKKFDRVVSVGMFEHVGYKNYRKFFKVVNRCLKKEGLLLLHTIGGNRSVSCIDPWIEKYIFPNAIIPSEEQIIKAKKGIFKIEDWHNFGADYDKTLMAWHKNFNKNWDEIKDCYGERFKRMWNYYLLVCAGSFRVRKNQLWQIVFTKIDSQRDYRSIR